MKKTKIYLSLFSCLFVLVILTGCITIELDVKRNGSCEATYVFDVSKMGGMVSRSDLREEIEKSLGDMNEAAGKKVARLKSVKEDKKNGTITAIITVNDINEMGDGSFFGTVKEYRKNNGKGLDNLMDTEREKVDEDKISSNLHIVYFSMNETNQYGLVETRVKVPGKIKYLTNGAELERKNTALFGEEQILVVFKKSGGFPLWLLLIVIGVIIYYASRKKKPAHNPVMDAAVSEPLAVTRPENLQENDQVNDKDGNNSSGDENSPINT